MSSPVPFSVVVPLGPDSTTCGYCSPPGQRSSDETSLHSANLIAQRLTCDHYQRMIDIGWRRSGTYCYRPNLRASCCPQYTIKLDATAFKASSQQRNMILRWNRYILEEPNLNNGQSRPKKNTAFILKSALHASESEFLPNNVSPSHVFQVVLEPASFTAEKFELYKHYQANIHNDHDKAPSSFERFLVKSPLSDDPIPYPSEPPAHLPRNYGSYHQLYRVDGALIAMGVIDILPHCVSSVYFMYHTDWKRFSLGKLSALREILLTQELHAAGLPQLIWLYLGFYIHSCPKMKYKGDYSPSFLADPKTYEWYPLEEWKVLLDKNRYACLSNPKECLAGAPAEEAVSTGMSVDHLPKISEDDLEDIQGVRSIRNGRAHVSPIYECPGWVDNEIRDRIVACVGNLGVNLAKEMIFHGIS